ncbi:MAG: DUF4345 family protein [Micropepsaceae bacterium]
MLSLTLGLILFAAMGGVLLWQPQYITRVTNVELSTPESRSEARAVYGGFGVAMALALLVAMISLDLRGGIMMTAGLSLIGMAAGRGYSAWLERPTNPIIWGLLGGEAILGLMLFFRVG